MTENVSFRLSLPKATYRTLQQVAKKKHKTESDILLDALRAYLDHLAKVDPFLGMFAEDADMMDKVVTYAMQTRESTPFRIHEGE